MTDLVDVASKYVGYVEQGGADGHSGNITLFGKAYGLDGYAWCSMFVWYCFHELGIDVRHDVSGDYAGCELAMEGFAAKGWEIHQHPQRNDVAFFHFPGEAAGADHTGIVVDADATGINTIEGNTSSGDAGSQSNGGGVYRRHRPFSTVIGYGRYPFPLPLQEAEVTPQEIEQVAQRVVELLKPIVATHDDMKTLLRGTADGQHPYSLTSIAKKLGI